jgi:hypothetical protein
MESSYLVQRLQKPYKTENNLTRLANAFSFGGGLVNGGIPEEGMKLLKDIFRFDYMGAAEFEFGAVPKALSKISENYENLIGFKIMAPYLYEGWDKGKKEFKGIKPVYILCHKDDRDEVVKRIKKWAKCNYQSKDFLTKEAVNLNLSLASQQLLEEKIRDYVNDTVGWLELDNGYFFFTDEEMFQKTCDLFDVKVEI